MHFPDFLEPYRSDGVKLLSQSDSRGFLFSGPTYQIEIKDPKKSEPFWVFLQFDDELHFKDLFCSCEESTEKGACKHMAAACLSLFSKNFLPPHVRFQKSLYNVLFMQLLENAGASQPKIESDASKLKVLIEDELLFSAKGSGKQYQALFGMLQPRAEETEETSIKFSNLTEEEIDNWRKGRPSFQLRYELSFFSDIAKWLFLAADVEVIFEPTNDLPKTLTIRYEDLELEVFLSKDLLVHLIPTLNSVPSNLRLLTERNSNLEAIAFNPKTAVFTLSYKGKITPPKGAKVVGSSIFVPKKGFMASSLPAKRHEEIRDPGDVAQFLNESWELVSNFFIVQKEPQPIQYQISFDQRNCLHVDAYISTPNDLMEMLVWGDWAYYQKTFTRIHPLKFKCVHLVLEPSEIPPFLIANRAWLSQFQGFFVHVAKLEEQIFYEVDEYGNMTFRSEVSELPSMRECIDLGDWIYAKGDGFYVKNFTDDNPPLPLGKLIGRHLVAEFIRHHIDLLEQVPGFFTAENPIKSIGLSIKLRKKGVIEILPQYEWHDVRDEHQSFFYDEFVYVKRRGFYRLPPNFRPMHFVREITAGDAQGWGAFFQDLLPKLKAEYRCHIDPRLEQASSLELTVSPKGEEKKGQKRLSDWDLDIYWKSQNGTISIQELMQAKRRHERYVPTNAGVIDLEDDRFHWLEGLKERKKLSKDGPLTLEPSDFLRLTAYDTIHVDTQGIQSREGFRHLLERLLQQKPVEPLLLHSLTSDLRPYQKHGVEWLWFLYQNGLSGLLCDDMGVGKTHQAMGLMDAIRVRAKQEGRKSLFLVVCPTSLIYHWQDKVVRFLSDFKVKVYVGLSRSLDDFPGDYDIFLTSYGIWRNESMRLKKYAFDAAFFDELQIAKNHVSQIHAALLQAQAEVKIGLTGTPIENQLRELKSLFDLVMPGYMPVDSDFREFFVRPIERAENPKRRELLSRFVRPFVLRRRKVDVLPDLPVKTEELYQTELLGEQKSLYRQVASQQALPLIQQLRDEASPIPYMHIFAVLSSLKQICNHPATYLKDVSNYERYESGKWEAFTELIEEAMESEQKVVVFSQFLAMLDIIELYLKKNGISYAQIRGQTKNRGEEVGRFHDDPNCRIFLGSLQAAGLGIDLTPASIVIHYDRWWNAARENQATDRVHRIGQVRGVQVFKLFTRSTIEEKIDRMIAKKAGLLEEIVSFDDHQIIKRLSRQEIIFLLEGLGEE